ncbi:hypothetical protein, partial [Xanthomonas arboricola]
MNIGVTEAQLHALAHAGQARRRGCGHTRQGSTGQSQGTVSRRQGTTTAALAAGATAAAGGGLTNPDHTAMTPISALGSAGGGSGAGGIRIICCRGMPIFRYGLQKIGLNIPPAFSLVAT